MIVCSVYFKETDIYLVGRGESPFSAASAALLKYPNAGDYPTAEYCGAVVLITQEFMGVQNARTASNPRMTIRCVEDVTQEVI